MDTLTQVANWLLQSFISLWSLGLSNYIFGMAFSLYIFSVIIDRLKKISGR